MLFSSSFYTTVVSDGLHEPYLLPTNSSFILILSDSHRGCLIWVKFVEIPKQKFESQLKGPLKYLLMPLLGKNQLAITLHMYASIGPNLDNTHRGQI